MVLVNGMECYFLGWGVYKRDGVLLSRIGCSIRNGVLVNGMECYFPGWCVSIWDRVLVNGIEC